MLDEGPIPILPGIATPSELMRAMGDGTHDVQVLPGRAGGRRRRPEGAGRTAPRRWPSAPTGGIDAANAAQFLALPNVLCVGGSWVAPAKAVEAGDWETISKLAAEAAALRP